MFRARVVIASCLGLLAACTSSREAEPESPLDDTVALYCAYLKACAPAWLEQFPGGTEEACRDVSSCTGSFRAPWVPSCMEGDEFQCLFGRLLGRGCEGEGERAGEGESCRRMECEEGLVCDFLDSSCPTCRSPLAVGETCATMCGHPGLLCGASAFCDPELLTCQPLHGAGEACRDGRECVDHVCTMGICEPSHGPGEPCRYGDDCEGYLTCRDGVCGPKSVAGDACDDVVECQPGLLCIQGQCEQEVCRDEVPRVGSPCRSFGSCGDGLYCNPHTEHCAETRALGEACTTPLTADGALSGLGDGECGLDGYCASDSRCAPRVSEGESCDEALCEFSLSCLPRQPCESACGCDLTALGPLTCQKYSPSPSSTCE